MKEIVSKFCKRCGEVKDASCFYKSKKDGLQLYCKTCITEYRRQQYRKNPEKGKQAARDWRNKNPDKLKEITKRSYYKNHEIMLERSREWRRNNQEASRNMTKRYIWRRKEETINAYGGKCECCGETTLEFLVIDHINGGGNAERKRIKIQAGTGFYNYLRNNGYPKGYRVLCHNCNMSLGSYGYCPHDKRLPK